MTVVALVFASIAALIHVYIFYLESLAWTKASTRATFGTTPAQAETTKAMAFNQGFYNLFLAIAAGLGVELLATRDDAVGATLIFVAAGSMVAAALVLVLSDRSKLRAALVQGVAPLIAVVALVVAIAG
jgi:putative membrane protein